MCVCVYVCAYVCVCIYIYSYKVRQISGLLYLLFVLSTKCYVNICPITSYYTARYCNTSFFLPNTAPSYLVLVLIFKSHLRGIRHSTLCLCRGTRRTSPICKNRRQDKNFCSKSWSTKR